MRHDCVFIAAHPWLPGIYRLDVVCVLVLFSFTFFGNESKCAVVHRYMLSEEPNNNTGMWISHPALNNGQQPDISVICLQMIYCTAHLIPVYGGHQISPDVQPNNCCNRFHAYYVSDERIS